MLEEVGVGFHALLLLVWLLVVVVVAAARLCGPTDCFSRPICFAVLFLFWTITAIAKKIVAAKGEVTNEGTIAIMGAGFIGALACTFSDSFWFSAVEGEVYASSAFFTAIVFWAIFKWENLADEKHSIRWIILIAYLMGLSIGVHLLNLLTIPAIAFVYYFRRYPVNAWGVIKTSVISITILEAMSTKPEIIPN